MMSAVRAGEASPQAAAAHRPSLGALLASTTTTAGSGLGPVVAGGLATASLRVPFLAEAALLGAGLVVAFRLPAAALGRRWRPTVPRVPPAMRAEFAVAGGVSFLAWAVAYIVLALAPSYVSERTHNTNVVVAGATTGLLLICAATVQLILAGWPARRAMTVGLLVLVAGLAGFVAAGRAGSLPLLLVTLAVTGAGQGLAFMGATRQATGSAPAGQRAEVAAAFWICSYLGGGLPVVGVGLLALRLGLVAAVDAVALALTCACLLMLAAGRRRCGIPRRPRW
ncbi:MAG: hypothetical protein V7603_5722 [Micromonosporaceae bacterium]